MNQVFGIELPAALPLLRTGEELTFRKRKREKTVTYKAAARVSKKSVIKSFLKEAVIDSKIKKFNFSDGFELAEDSKGKFNIKEKITLQLR
jgi:hypothetical protein